ncbi:MAG TPA: DUF1800 domain-containing protein [Longimicrobiaceae bacterium]|nr:DUF1800 domain-containing protein [Longimicrobiaceae bacterium]
MRAPLPSAAHRAAAAAVVAGAVLFLGLVPAAGTPRAPRERPSFLRRQAAEDTARALHLLQRATFGVRGRDLQEVLRTGADAWLERQLHPERIPDASIEPRLAAFPAAQLPPAALFAAFPPPRPDPARRARRDSMEAMGGEEMMSAEPGERGRRRGADGARAPGPQRILFELAGAKLTRAVHSERQLQEVMTDFWFNHFNVFFGKNQDRYLVGDYERTAIRPHVFGRFRDLLGATAAHPAMLVYLDNWTSAAVDSTAAGAEPRARWNALTPAQRRRAIASGRVRPEQVRMLESGGAPPPRPRRPRGLNENYARELMELHTLGVDGGYTQHDVVEVARAFTGWTLELPRRGEGERVATGFAFRAGMHDAGEKVVLGRRLAAGRGIEDGREVLDVLARHPATARHVALKLAQRFVADEPPPALVERLAEVFQRSDGDLREVTRALFTSPEFADPRYRGGKVKTPFEFVASALRATGAHAAPSRTLLQTLRQLGQVPYAASDPTGYPHTSEEWTNGGAMLNRMSFGLALASGAVDGVWVDPALLQAPGGAVQVDALAAALLPGRSDPQLLAAIRADAAAQAARSPRERSARAVGLVIGSPAFQRR